MKRSLFVISIVLVATAILAQEQMTQPRVVEISAKKFEFTPSSIVLKAGEPVTIRASSQDRGHGFYQEDLGIDLDVQPDKAAEVTITPKKPGHYVAICDEFCGSGHGNMKMTIDVVE